VTKLAYRNALILGAFVFAGVCILWILLGPETTSLSPLKRNGELTTKGWISLLCGLPIFLLMLPHVFHVITRRPALEVCDEQLKIWMLPYESIPLADISKIEVGDDSIDIHRHGKKLRRVNARVLDEPRYFFFDEVRPRLPNGDMVREK
jgi:hypothetical protein